MSRCLLSPGPEPAAEPSRRAPRYRQSGCVRTSAAEGARLRPSRPRGRKGAQGEGCSVPSAAGDRSRVLSGYSLPDKLFSYRKQTFFFFLVVFCKVINHINSRMCSNCKRCGTNEVQQGTAIERGAGMLAVPPLPCPREAPPEIQHPGAPSMRRTAAVGVGPEQPRSWTVRLLRRKVKGAGLLQHEESSRET